MLTVKETAMELLLEGQHLNKSDFLRDYHTFTLTQRIEEIRRIDGWNIQSKTIPGRKGMVEYWLGPEEIQRIKDNLKPFKEIKAEVEQLTENLQKAVEIEDMKPTEQLVSECAESLENEQKIYEEEQLGLGLPWE